MSADTIVPQPSDPQSLNRFSFVRNNPLKYVDPTGHCPKPMDSQDKANVICVAFFIPTKRSNTIPIIGRTFVGDGRDISWNSDEDGSRGWVHLDADTGEIIKYKFHRTEDADTGEKWDPLKDNTLKSEIQEDGSIKLKYSFLLFRTWPTL
jgi:hypothetical protein